MARSTKRIADGNIRRIKGNAYMEDLKSGNAIAGIVWSGDLFDPAGRDRERQLGVRHPGVRRHALERQHDGSDHLDAPAQCPGADGLLLPNPDVAAEVAAYVNYVCPVVGAQEEMRRSTPSWPRARSSSRAGLDRRHNIKGSGRWTPAEGRRVQRRCGQRWWATDGRLFRDAKGDLVLENVTKSFATSRPSTTCP
jgi:spermidine/putrescine transport system substrate-binding protein